MRAAEAIPVAIVNVDVAVPVPLGVTVAGLKLQEAFWGRPEQAKLTCWLNPPDGVMVIVEVAVLPLVTVPLVGERPTVKLAGTAAVMVMERAAEVDGEKFVSPP